MPKVDFYNRGPYLSALSMMKRGIPEKDLAKCGSVALILGQYDPPSKAMTKSHFGGSSSKGRRHIWEKHIF